MATSTRDLLIDAAVSLFARRGFKATTVAQIEEAAGLAPGSGGLYRHFTSKQALLEEAVRRAEVHQMAPTLDDERLFDFDHPDVSLRAIGEISLAGTRRDAGLYALLRQPPDDLAGVVVSDALDRLMTQGVIRLARWMEMLARMGTFRTVDFAAVAYGAVGALSWFHVTHDQMGVSPGGVDEQRFLDAWVATYLAVLTPD